MSNIVMIAAVSENRVIADDDGIPWHLPEDLKHYISTVSDGTVIYGRKTFEDAGQTGVNTVVLSSQEDWSHEDENVYHAENTEEALEIAESLEPDNIYIGGGERVYEEYLDLADRMVISHVHDVYEGSVYFPKYSEDNWVTTEEDERDGFTIVEYDRVD